MTDFALEFEDDKELAETEQLLERYIEGYQYHWFTKQSQENPKHNWGDNLNILMMSDRCPGRARGLCDYLRSNTKLSSVKLCHTLEDAKDYIQKVSIDILMFVGYQENKSNYDIKRILKGRNNRVYSVMYAFLDSIIERYCNKYKIKYAFSYTKPVAELIDYMDISYSLHEFFLAEGIDDEMPVDEQMQSSNNSKTSFLVG